MAKSVRLKLQTFVCIYECLQIMSATELDVRGAALARTPFLGTRNVLPVTVTCRLSGGTHVHKFKVLVVDICHKSQVFPGSLGMIFTMYFFRYIIILYHDKSFGEKADRQLPCDMHVLFPVSVCACWFSNNHDVHVISYLIHNTPL